MKSHMGRNLHKHTALSNMRGNAYKLKYILKFLAGKHKKYQGRRRYMKFNFKHIGNLFHLRFSKQGNHLLDHVFVVSK